MPDIYGSLTPEPIEGNSLTRYMRSTNNYMGSAGKSILEGGGNTFSQGLSRMSPAVNYWTSILSGSPTETATALAPDANRIRSAEGQSLQATGTLTPRGGGRASTLFSLPLSGNAQIQSLFNSLRPMAAQQTGNLGSIIAQLGQGQQRLGLEAFGQLLQSLLTGRGQDVAEHGQAMGLAGQLAGSAMGDLTAMRNTNVMAGR